VARPGKGKGELRIGMYRGGEIIHSGSGMRNERKGVGDGMER
jgi:hypothetical protein